MSFVRVSVLMGALTLPLLAAGCGHAGSGGVTPEGTLSGVPLVEGRTSMSTTTVTPPPASSYTFHVTGPIVAIKSATEFQIQGGPGVGYLNVFTTGSTVKNANGLTVAVGVTADVYGSGSASTQMNATWYSLSKAGATPSPSPSPSPAATGTPAPITTKHVLTAGLIYGYSGTPTSVALTSMAPYVSWAQTDPSYAAELRAAGIKVDVYMNFWRNYTGDNPNVGYQDLKPGGAHAAAEVKTCSGAVVTDPTYGGGYEANALSSSASAHAAVVATYRENEYAGGYDALFADDAGALYGIATPCGYTDTGYKTATNNVHQSLGKTMFINTLNAGTSVVSQVGYATATNVIGAMCESCYAYWQTTNGVQTDYARTDGKWADTENGEALMVSKHKIFWDYARAIGDASKEIGLRTYTYASFLLTYDPSYAMLQEIFSTPSGFEIFPETGLVPMQPATTSTSVSSYERTGGAYMREFKACYYRGAFQGACAVIVNPSSTASAKIPTSAYHHSMTLSGYGVLDGGKTSFAGAVPASLAPQSATILFP